MLSGYGILFGITESMRMEQLTDKDKIVGIATHPLEQYFDTLKARPRFFLFFLLSVADTPDRGKLMTENYF